MSDKITTSNLEILGDADKGHGQVIRVSVGEWQERTFVYLEIWQKDLDDKMSPGVRVARGLTLSPRMARELLPLIEAAVKVAEGRPRPQRNPPRRREPDWAVNFDGRARNGGSQGR